MPDDRHSRHHDQERDDRHQAVLGLLECRVTELASAPNSASPAIAVIRMGGLAETSAVAALAPSPRIT